MVCSMESGPLLHIHPLPCLQMVHLFICYFPSMWMTEWQQPTLQSSTCTLSHISTAILPLVTSVPSVAFLASLLTTIENKEYSICLRRLSLRSSWLRMVCLLPIPRMFCYFQDQAQPCLYTLILRHSPVHTNALLYLASWTCPDLAYTVVPLMQWNTSPTR